jgi:hypothetical protein
MSYRTPALSRFATNRALTGGMERLYHEAHMSNLATLTECRFLMETLWLLGIDCVGHDRSTDFTNMGK